MNDPTPTSISFWNASSARHARRCGMRGPIRRALRCGGCPRRRAAESSGWTPSPAVRSSPR